MSKNVIMLFCHRGFIMVTMDDSIIVDLHSKKNEPWLSNVLKELLHNATDTLTKKYCESNELPIPLIGESHAVTWN